MSTTANLPALTQPVGLNHSAARLYKRWLMSGLMVASDLGSLVVCGILAIILRSLITSRPGIDIDTYINIFPIIITFIIAYSLSGLYPGIGITPALEIQRLCVATTGSLLVLVSVAFYTQTSITYSRSIFGMFWVFSLMGVPLSRGIVRWLALKFRVWGEPVALIGCGNRGQEILSYLLKNKEYGFTPKVVINGSRHRGDEEKEVILTYPAEVLDEKKDLLSRMGIDTAILIPSEVPEALLNSIVQGQNYGLRRVILISSLNWFGGSAVVPHDLQGILGLEVEHNLLNKTERVIKRAIDVLFILFGSIFLAPVVGLISLLIRLDTHGPIFYCQTRIGIHGLPFRIWKFRTMIENADQILLSYLSSDEAIRREWEASYKLKHDPRITRVGKFLRKTSLDELPQLWNILMGEMSLVGPRPIVEDEIKHYKNTYNLYQQVRPGITGLWQVSGRSDTSYEYRVSLDEYYIRHWSVWQDIYILLRTFWIVITRNGAY